MSERVNAAQDTGGTDNRTPLEQCETCGEPIADSLSWIEVAQDDAANDELVTHHKGFEIRLLIPNGGIVGVSVCGKGRAWSAPTGRRYHEDWHVACAKRFIEELATIGGRS